MPKLNAGSNDRVILGKSYFDNELSSRGFKRTKTGLGREDNIELTYNRGRETCVVTLSYTNESAYPEKIVIVGTHPETLEMGILLNRTVRDTDTLHHVTESVSEALNKLTEEK